MIASGVRAVALLSCGLLVAIAEPGAQSAPDAAPVQRLIAGALFKQATAFIASDYDRFVNELITLTEIPAPPFKEAARARAYAQMLRDVGLGDVEIDAEGNAMGIRKGTGDGSIVAVVAHLDTVFPEGTDVKVKRQGTRLAAPGIGDNTRGLALALAIVRAMNAAKFQTANDLLMVGNVGEEGEGDLRGVKFLLRKGKYKDRIKQFIAIDGGTQETITRGGVGSLRYRVTFKGPGGHSYGAFGLVNPAYAMGNAIAKLATVQVPATPKTTYNVGVVGGGTSINSIPSAVQMDVDLRSESCASLKELNNTFREIIAQAANAENQTRSTREGRIDVDPKLIGDRPCGETPPTSPIVQTASAVVSVFGMRPEYGISSTDSNVPMHMGMPAITIGRGGPGGRAHSPDEWTDVARPEVTRAVEVATAIILAVAGAR
jgi:tripeptide aminopeptidase